LEPSGRKGQEAGENYVMKSIIILLERWNQGGCDEWGR